MRITKKQWEHFYNFWRREKRKAQRLVKKTQIAKVGWKVINQRKIKGYFSIWKRYLKYIDLNPGAQESKIKKQTGIHWRGTMYLRYLGLLHLNSSGNNQIITEPGRKFYQDSTQRKRILQQQVEKWHYCVRNFFKFGDESYTIYPFFLLLKVLLVIGKKFQVKNKPAYFVSLDEFRYFVITAKKYEEWKKSVNFITAYRESNYKQKSDLESIFANSTSYDRIIFLLELSKFLTFNKTRVYLKENLISEAKKLIANFEYLYRQRLVPLYQKQPEKYLNILYADINLVDFCRENESIDEVVDQIIKMEIKEEISEGEEEILEEKIKPLIKPSLQETRERIRQILERRKKNIRKRKRRPQKKQTFYSSKDAERAERTIGKVLAQYYGKCQISDCGYSFPKGKNGKKGSYCEAHHLQKLSDNGKDLPQNIVVLCANHHRQFHYDDAKLISGDDKKLIVELCGKKKIIFLEKFK